MKKELLNRLSKSDDLPPLPEILITIEKKMRNPETSISEISEVLTTEPVLSGRVMKLANSAFYSSGRQEVQSLNTAIMRLGLREVNRIVYSIELSKMFKSHDRIDLHQFWRHSVAVANLAQILCEKLGEKEEEVNLAYMAGLMHDVGIMIFANIMPTNYPAFLQASSFIEKPLYIQEKESFELNHAELGALYIRKWWDADDRLVQAVANHHFPFTKEKDTRLVSQVVNIANAICNNQGISNGVDIYTDMFNEGAWEELGLPLEEAVPLVEKALYSVDKAEELLRA